MFDLKLDTETTGPVKKGAGKLFVQSEKISLMRKKNQIAYSMKEANVLLLTVTIHSDHSKTGL